MSALSDPKRGLGRRVQTADPCTTLAGDVKTLPPQLPPDLAHAIDLEILGEHTPDLHLGRHIPLCPGGQLRRIGPLGCMLMVRGRGDRQDLADRLDPIRLAVIVDERDHGLNRRSSSAWAK